MLGSQLMSWFNQKQTLIATSTAKAKYICNWDLLCTNPMDEAAAEKL